MCDACDREEDRTPEGSAITGLWNAVAILGGLILLKWAAEWACGLMGVGK